MLFLNPITIMMLKILLLNDLILFIFYYLLKECNYFNKEKFISI